MPLKPGSKAPEKTRSLLVRELAPRFKEATAEEAAVLRGLLDAQLANRDADGSPLSQSSPRNRCVVALDGADLTCRLAEGHGLVTIRDYGDHQRPGDPSASWIVRVLGGGCWVSALSAAGIGAERYLEPILIRGSGARTRPGGGEAWSLPERVDALALAIERNHGYELTKDVWEHYRDIVPFETPTYPTLKGSRTKNGKATSQYTLAQMHELARKLILREPERFPVAAAHVQLVAAVRAKERRRKAKPRRKAA